MANLEERKAPFEAEELEMAVKSGNVHHTLNNENLSNAARIIFGESDHMTREYYEKTIIAGNYIGFDLEKHGFPNLLADLKILTEFFRTAIHTVTKSTKQRSGKVFFMGEGPGRTAIAAIELAKQLKIEEIVFNDLLSEHLDQTREKIAKCYNTREQKIDGVEINFLAGDFIEIASNIRKNFDALFAMWFVASEICDFSSIKALRKRRNLLYSQIRKLLTKQGVFVEDIPFSAGVGTFYYTARLKTYAILHEMGILEGENNHMLLSDFTDIQKGGFPYHIRYVPSNGKHRDELAKAKLKEHISTLTTLPSGIKNPTQYEAEFGSPEKIQQLFEGNSIDEIIPFIEKKERDLLIYPSPTDIMAQQKKTIMWRPQT